MSSGHNLKKKGLNLMDHGSEFGLLFSAQEQDQSRTEGDTCMFS
jgi:hypothetical protein